MEKKFEFPEILFEYVNELEGYILEYKKTKETDEDGLPLYVFKIYNDDGYEERAKYISRNQIDLFKYGFEKPIEEIDAEVNYELEVAPFRINLTQAKNDEKFFKKKKLIELKKKTEKLVKDLSDFPEKLFRFHVPQYEEDTFILEFHLYEVNTKHGESAVYLEKPVYEDDIDEEEKWDNITIHISEINNPDEEVCITEPPYRLNEENVKKDFEKYIEALKDNLYNYGKEMVSENKAFNFPDKLYYFNSEMDSIIIETKSEDTYGISNKKNQCKYSGMDAGKKEFYILPKERISDTLPMSVVNPFIHRTTIEKAVEDSENWRKEKLSQLTSQVEKLKSPPKIIQ